MNVKLLHVVVVHVVSVQSFPLGSASRSLEACFESCVRLVTAF